MKQPLTFLLFALALTSCSGQNKMSGKTYIAEVGATCKDGIGMIYTYRVLKFYKDSVKSYYIVKAYVSQDRKEMYEHMRDNDIKTYRYKVNKNTLIIENCEELGKLKIEPSKLLGYDQNSMQGIEFSEQSGKNDIL